MMKKKEEENKQETEEKKDTRMTNLLVILTVVIFAAISAVVLFVPGLELKPEYLGYLIGAVLVILGIVFIVRYFVTDAYKNMNAYGFSAGSLLVILGICALLRADAIGVVFDLVLGVAVLLMGIIMLQHSLDLKRMSDFMWIIALIFSLLAVACGVIMILKLSPEKLDYSTYNWWAVLISSGIGFIINIYTLIRVAIYNSHEKKAAEQEKKEQDVASSDGSGDSGSDYSGAGSTAGESRSEGGTDTAFDTSYTGMSPEENASAYLSSTETETSRTPADAIMGALSAIGEQEMSENASAEPETYETGSVYEDYSNRILSYDLKASESETAVEDGSAEINVDEAGSSDEPVLSSDTGASDASDAE